MPSPLGHALGGISAGWLVAGRPGPRATALRSAGWYGLLGVLPDIDFLLGTHSTYTHSLGAVAIVGTTVFVLAGARHRGGGQCVVGARHARRGPWPVAMAAAAAYGTHVLFDWLGNDNSPPIGIMALWPFSSGFFQSDAHLFEAISRRYWLPGFVAHNLRAVAWELVLLTPIVLIVGRWRARRE